MPADEFFVLNLRLTTCQPAHIVTAMKSGAEQFKDWMQRRRFKQREAADHLGFDETFVSQLVNGRRSPGLDNAVLIERLTGIPVEAWLSHADDNSVEAVAAQSRKSQSGKA